MSESLSNDLQMGSQPQSIPKDTPDIPRNCVCVIDPDEFIKFDEGLPARQRKVDKPKVTSSESTWQYLMKAQDDILQSYGLSRPVPSEVPPPLPQKTIGSGEGRDAMNSNKDGIPWYKSYIFIAFCTIVLIVLLAGVIYAISSGYWDGEAAAETKENGKRRMQQEDELFLEQPLAESASSNFALIPAVLAIFALAVTVSIQSIFIYYR